jgi:hypothetical protein
MPVITTIDCLKYHAKGVLLFASSEAIWLGSPVECAQTAIRMIVTTNWIADEH